MKNKFNFLVKLICVISILISISIFVVFIVNFENTKVKLAAITKGDIKTEFQEENVKPGKVEVPEVVIESENTEDSKENIEIETPNESDEIEKYTEIELSNENCEYTINSENDTVSIEEYNVSMDSIVIPNEIEGKKVEKINTDNFSECYNLETIKIPKEISEQIESIPNFEKDEDLEDENYVVYTTTREYGEAYKGYLELSEEEKAKVNIIPPKYEKPLELVSKNKIMNLQPVGSVTIGSSYDLRDDINIKVENQNPYGICYAYSSFTAAETFWALNNNETIDLSEVHAAILTTGNGGQTFVTETPYYLNKLGPVYEEEYPVYDVRGATFPNATSIDTCINSSSPSSYPSIQNAAKTKTPVNYVNATHQFGTITQELKQDPEWDAAIANERNKIKTHIKTYGALAAIVNSNTIVEYNGKMVENDQSTSGVNHGVTVIGWDDNFSTLNFPSSSRPSENGAYLVLNSWGSDWGEDGCYWVSYEDKWIEYYLIGVTDMTESSENLKTSSMVVTDQSTGNILDNGYIPDGTKIKIKVDATVTNKTAGENVTVSLRDNTTDYTSYMTVSGTKFNGNTANLEMTVDTASLKGDQYALEIKYGTETVSKMIETPKDFSYSVNADGTISIIAYNGDEKEITIPSEYDGYRVTKIAKDAFIGSTIEKVIIEPGITSIGEYAFRGCEKLKTINIPRTVTTIGDAAFLACSSLEEIIIPRSVKTLGAYLVQQCTSLKTLVIFKETTTIGGSMIYNTPYCRIYCESGSSAEVFAKNWGYTYSVITENYNITYNKNTTDTVTNMPSTQNKVKYDTISMSSNIPVRSGYKFLGWATTSSAIQAQYQPGDDYRTDANLNLYAVWEATEKELSYTIEYYKDGVKDDSKVITVKIPVAESSVTLDKSNINTTNKYLGYELEKTEPAQIPDTVTDGTVIKVYYKLQNYTITYDLDGGEVKEGENPTSYTVKELVSLLNPEKEGYTFIGWTGSNGNTPQKSISIEPGTTGNKTYKANYTINSYNLEINYITEDGNEVAQRYTENINYLESFEVISPEVYGYIPNIPVVEGIMMAGDIYIDVIYSREVVTYIVNHYIQTQSNVYTLEDKELRQGYVGDEAIAIPKEYQGFTCDRWTRGNIIEADGNTVVSVYYKRNIYTITYFVDEEQYGESEQHGYDCEVTLREKPTKLGYNFDGWYYLDYELSGSITITQDFNLYGTFIKDETQTKELSYTVEYYIDGIKQEDDTEQENAIVHVSEPNTISVNKAEINTTNKYVGYKLEKTEPAQIPDTVENGDVIKVYYSLETYDITYDLDGGNLPTAKENPTTYTVNDLFVLEIPEKEGYTFIGWTGSNGNTPEKTVTIEKGTTGDKTYKANYQINAYTVTYKVDGEIYGEVETYEYGKTITPRNYPEKEGYAFTGWGEIPDKMPARNLEFEGMFYVDGTQIKELKYTVEYYKDNVKQDADTIVKKSVVQVLEPDEMSVDKSQINTSDKYIGYLFEKTEPAVVPDTVKNGDVIKIYYTAQNYTISYDLDGGILPEGKTNPETYTVNDSFVLEAPEKEGHTFTGWTGSNGEEAQETVTISKGTTGNKQYKANYSVNKYMLVINYDMPNDAGLGPVSYHEMLEYGKRYYKEVMKCPGYTPSMEVVEGIMGAEDITYNIDYFANTDTEYKVEHYKQNILDNNFTLSDTDYLIGTTDTLTEAIQKEYEGFSVVEFEQEKIKGDESTVVRIYYDRNVYKINYFVGYSESDTTWGLTTQEYRFEETVYPLEDPQEFGRKFDGWIDLPETMPAYDVDITGKLSIDESQTIEVKYTVEYYKNGVRQDADTQVEKKIIQVLQPFEIEVDKSKINITDKYLGYEFYGTNTTGIPEKVIGNEVIKIYYIPIKYGITYDLDAGTLKEGENPEKYTIEDEVTFKNPEKEGYTFIGWTGSNGEKLEETLKIEKGSTGDKHYKANYRVNEYTLTYKVDGEVYGEVETYKYGESITAREEPTKLGYIFSGWSEIPEVMPAHDVEITGTFAIDESQAKELSYTVEYYRGNVKQDADTEIEKVKVLMYESDEITVNKEKINTTDKYLGCIFNRTEPAEIPEKVMNGEVIKVYYSISLYNIDYFLNGGVLPEGKNNPMFYSIDDSFELEKPTKIGYNFDGWTGSNGEIPEKVVKIEKGTTGEKHYRANYTPIPYTLTVRCISDITGDCIKTLQYTYTFGEYYNIKAPEIDGYTLKNINGIYDKMPAKDHTIEFYYIPNIDTKYTVEHYKQNILDNKYTLAETEELSGTTDTLTEVNAKEYVGFTSQEATQDNINGDGSTVVKVYYDRNVYSLTYKVDDVVDGEPEEYRYEEAISPRKYPEKLGYKFTGWSEIPETMPANDVEVTGRFEFDETQTKELNYTVEYYKDNVKQDADTEIEKVTVHVLESDEITVDKSKINITDKYEACILDEELTNIPDIVTNGDVIKVYYNRKDAKVIVEYRDFITGEEISEKTIKTAKVFDLYDITEDKKEIEGYTFIEGPEELVGEYTEEEQTKVYKYAKNSKVTVNYIEKSSGNVIAEPIVINGYETKDYITEAKTIENYMLLETPENKSGKMTREDIVVNYYYIYISDGVIERHIDVITNDILETIVYQGNEGDSYKTEPKEFEGYTLVEDRLPTNAEGVMTKDAIIVEYFYIRNATVKVKYVDKISNEILTEEVIEGFENTSYETTEKEFEGYELVEKPTNAEGNMTVTKDENGNVMTETTVIYYYKKISEGVITRFYDIKSNELLDENVHSGLEGDAYKTEAKEFEGYDLVEERIPENSEGTLTKEKIEVNYYYIRKTTVKVEYIDVITNEKIIEDVIINNHEGDEYETERKVFEEYILLEDRLPENEKGITTVTKDENDVVNTEIVVRYYYIRKATVRVEYINKATGEKISEDTIIEGNEGKSYKAEPKEIDGYNLLNENENTEGIMTREEIVARFYYEKIIDSEEYQINDNDIKKITVGTTIEDLKEKMTINEEYTIIDNEGNEVSGTDIIKTGMKLKLENGQEYELIVRGDLNCDGEITLTDLSKLILHYNGMRGFILTDCPYKAADMNFDSKITLTDISQMVVFYNSI